MPKTKNTPSIIPPDLPILPETPEEKRHSAELIALLNDTAERLEKRNLGNGAILARLAQEGKLDKTLTAHFAELGRRFSHLTIQAESSVPATQSKRRKTTTIKTKQPTTDAQRTKEAFALLRKAEREAKALLDRKLKEAILLLAGHPPKTP